MKGIMNLTEDKVKLVGYTFALSLLIPPNVGLNILGLNFEDLPLIFLFIYLLYTKINEIKKDTMNRFDSYFLIFLTIFILYTNFIVDSIKIFNQTNLRFYFYFLLAYLIISKFDMKSDKIINIFEPLNLVMIANFLLVIFQIDIEGDLNGWISNNTGGVTPFTSGRLGGFQGGGPNVIGIFCSISALIYIYKILQAGSLFKYFKDEKLNTSILIISLLNLFFTYSRGSYLAFAIGFLLLVLITDKIKFRYKTTILIFLSLSSFLFISLNPSIFLKQSNRSFLQNLAIENVRLFKGTGGGNYVKEVYKDYLVTLDDETLKKKFNIEYIESEKNNSKKKLSTNDEILTKGFLKLNFDYKDRFLPRSIISFYHSKNGTEWEKIGFDHTNGGLINLIENDSYFEVGGWGDGQSSDDSFLSALIKEVKINTELKNNIYKFPKYKRGVDYYILTPKFRNVYRGNIKFDELGIQLERPRGYWLALPNDFNLSKKDFEIIVNLEIEGIPKGNETIFSQSSILKINEEFNDQSWKWLIVDGSMYFFWIENVDNGYVNYLGGTSLRSGKLISVNGEFQSIISEFNSSQYDEITTSHNGFLTMAVEYGLFITFVLIFLTFLLIFKNLKKVNTLEITILLVFLVQNLTNDLVYSPDVGIYFWLIPIFFLRNILIIDN